MKIGILTQPLYNNYGGIIQNYALQTILKKLGHTSITIDRHKEHKISFGRDSIIKIFQLLKIKKIPFIPTSAQEIYLATDLYDFILKKINKTEKIDTHKKFIKYIENNTFDAYIVGSDQVWRPIYSPDLYTYFLDFAPSQSLKLSYAASFGVDKWEFSETETERCKKLLAKFDFISVREDSAVDLCLEHFQLNAKQLIDPTMLLEKEEYLDLLEPSAKHTANTYLYTYILDRDIEKERIVSFVSNKLELKEYSVMPKERFGYATLNQIEKCKYSSMSKWLEGFVNAKFVIVDSFHGCVFSIIFNKPFIAISNKKRGITRFKSLLKKFGLEKQLVSHLDFDPEILSDRNFNWNEINEIRRSEKNIAIDCIKNILNK